MDPSPAASEFRFEKRRTEAVMMLVSGESVHGCFFTAGGTARHAGGERVGDILNAETGFFPFETQVDAETRTVQYNRAHVVTVAVFDEEVRRDPGYAVATRRDVSILLSNGRRINGVVLIHRPAGRDRLSDWTRQPEIFRYIETADSTYLVNAAHIVTVTEVSGS